RAEQPEHLAGLDRDGQAGQGFHPAGIGLREVACLDSGHGFLRWIANLGKPIPRCEPPARLTSATSNYRVVRNAAVGFRMVDGPGLVLPHLAGVVCVVSP